MAFAPASSPALALVALLAGSASGLVAQPARSAPPSADSAVRPWLHGRIGVQVQSLTPELREHFSVPQDRGLLVARVESDRPGQRAGVRVGDVLVEAGGEPLRHPTDLLRIVTFVADGDHLELRLVRDGQQRTLQVEPERETQSFPGPDVREGIERWLEHGRRHGSRGSRELRDRIDDLEERLEELERRLVEGGGEPKPT